jgi:predicted nuclease with TOPRIM domain
MEKEKTVEQILIELQYIKKELEEIKETQKALIKLQEALAVIKHRLDTLEGEVEEIYSDMKHIENSKSTFLWDVVKLFISFILGILSAILVLPKKS